MRRHIAQLCRRLPSVPLSAGHVAPFESIPGPAEIPYLGSIPYYKYGAYGLSGYEQALRARFARYGPIFKESFFGQTVVHVMDPQMAQEVLRHDGRTPHTPPLLDTVKQYRRMRGMSPGLGNDNGAVWSRLRREVNHLQMKADSASHFLPEVNEVADDFVMHLANVAEKNGGLVENMRNEIMLWQIESSVMTVMGKRLNGIGGGQHSLSQKLVTATLDTLNLSFKLKFSLPVYKFAPSLSPTWKALEKAEDIFYGTGQCLLNETLMKMEAQARAGTLGARDFRFVRHLLASNDLTQQDVNIAVLSLMADGLFTTAPTLMEQLYCLASNPDKQEKLFREIKKICPDPGMPITADMLANAPYLKACIKEALRLFPIGLEISRISQRDMIVGGYHIPPETQVEMNLPLLQRSPDHVTPQPDDFWPERWLSRGDAPTPGVVRSFGSGARMCPGQRLALQEIGVVLMKLLSRGLGLGWPHERPLTQRYTVLMHPAGPDSISLQPRHGHAHDTTDTM